MYSLKFHILKARWAGIKIKSALPIDKTLQVWLSCQFTVMHEELFLFFKTENLK